MNKDQNERARILKCLRIGLRSISWVVPQECRQDWLESWHSEFRHWLEADSPSSWPACFRHFLGALSHALWLRASQWRPGIMLQDLSYGFRQLSRNLGFTLTAAGVLALGIGATTTVFTFLNGLLLRPIPVVRDAGNLVTLWRTQDGQGSEVVSYPVFEYYRDRNDVLDGLAAFSSRTFPVSRGGELLLLEGELVSPNYFSVLGVPALLGNVLEPGQRDQFVVLLSYRLWMEQFAGNPSVLGQTLTVRGYPLEIQGVLPEGFRGTDRLSGPDLWLPIGLEDTLSPSRWGKRLELPELSWLAMIGRLRPGVTLQQASRALQPLAAELRRLYPQNGEAGIALRTATGLDPEAQREARSIAALLMGLVGLLLLISCANVSSLILARNGLRAQEWGVRLALGSGRLRLIRQLLVESSLLALLAAAAALLVAYWSGGLLVRLFATLYGLSFSIDPTPDQRVFFFALGVSVLCVVLIGLGPALRSSKTDLTNSLRPGGGRLTPERRWRSWLVAAQFSICLLIVAGGGLFLRTLGEMQAVDPGFVSDHTVVYPLFPEFLGISEQRGQTFYRQLLDQLQSWPDLQAAALSTTLPLTGKYESAGVQTQDVPHIHRPYLIAERNVIAGNYFSSLEIPLLKGRTFSRGDTSQTAPVAIVSEALARTLWPDGDVIGRTFDAGGDTDLRVIGVVADIKYRDIRESQRLAYYRPLSQDYRGSVFLQVRSRSNGKQLDGRLRELMAGLLPEHPLSGTTLAERIGDSMGRERMLAQFSGIFSLVALLLTGVGLYGVVAFNVHRRVREIGIRCALGASGKDVMHEVLRDGLRVAAGGLLAGLILLIVFSRFIHLSGTLYKVHTLDPITLLGTFAILLAVGLLASLIPGWRAAALDPAAALRCE